MEARCSILGTLVLAGFAACGGVAMRSSGATDAGDSGAVPCGPLDPALVEADAANLFDYPHVPAFDFYLPKDAWENLQKNARDEQFVPVQGCFEGKSIGQIGLRFKGYYGSLANCFDSRGEMICSRLSMKIKFSEYDDAQRFHGLKRLNFHAYRYDDSRIKERLTYDLFRAMGVVAPRASWAVVRVNGENQGLFGMVEEVDGRFTSDRWPDMSNGNLYKEVWPSHTDAGSILAGLKTNEDVANVSAFQAFAQAMTAASEDQLRSTLGKYTDLDYLARYMAVDDATTNYDGITYFWTDGVTSGNHNFYFYEEGPKQFHLVPWDVEATFWINPDHKAPHWTTVPDDCNQTYAYWDGLAKAPQCDPVIRAMAADLGGWRAAGRELLDGPFAETTMLATIDRHAAFIRAEVKVDPTPLMYGTFDAAVGYMRSQIPAMRARFEKLMADSGP